MFNNLIDATDYLGRHLHSFAGHRVDATHTSYMFTELAKACSYMKKESSSTDCFFEGKAWIDSTLYDVTIRFAGRDMNAPVKCFIMMGTPEEALARIGMI